jgi:hypothetical protein
VNVVTGAVVAALVTIVGVVADRLLLRAEERGWIYYRRRRASPGSAASAALEIQKILEPRTRHVLTVQRDVRPIEDDAGDPPAGPPPAGDPPADPGR